MEFDPEKYGPEVARVLALDGNGQRLMPLTCLGCSNKEAKRELQHLNSKQLFPSAKRPEAPMAGLWLYFSCFEEAHQLADSCTTKDGEFWHAILHRQEPDSGNSAYWFRRVSSHPIFQDLAREATQIIRRIPEAEFRVGKWDPYAFIAFCERARNQPGSAQERVALEIQRAEWQLLFDHCSSSAAHNGLTPVRSRPA